MRSIRTANASSALVLALGTLWSATPVQAQAEVPLEKQASMLLKALSYDRALAKRSGGDLKLAILYKGGTEEAARAAEMARQFKAATVKGVNVTTLEIAFESTGKLLEIADEFGLHAMYADASIKPALSGFLQVSRGRKIVSLGGSKELVELGLALGVYLKNGRPRLLINERAAKVEGLDLDPAIKLIATVIK